MCRWLALLAIFLIACKSGEQGKSHEPPDLQIVSAGNEPRRVLRYQPTKGASVTLEIAVDVDVAAGDMGGPMPTIVETLSMTVDDVSPIGAKIRTTVLDATARDRDESRVSGKALAGPLANMKGIVVTTTLSPGGRLIGTKADVGDKPMPDAAKTALAALTASLDQLMMPLPDEAVGVGAVWRNSRPLDQNGMKMTAVNSIGILELTDDKLTYTIDTEVHGDDQTVKQGDVSVEIKDITGTGKGKGTIDLHSLALTHEMTAEFRSAMQVPGETSATPMRMTIATHVAPK